ncbi:hypothetical protein A2U01_0095188, partial [Trifolium medium]|nr:hypothetical protein [Trifolium medium]
MWMLLKQMTILSLNKWKKGIGRRLRSRTPKPTSSTKIPPSVTKKAKESALKPV